MMELLNVLLVLKISAQSKLVQITVMVMEYAITEFAYVHRDIIRIQIVKLISAMIIAFSAVDPKN
jgi:hypothetical protein